MSEFTSGQWRYQAETKEVVYYKDGEEFVICDLSHMRTENANLNGKLLAAARELYAALEMVLNQSWDGPIDTEHYARKQAAAALAKARGE
jgi:hypothetical protein